MAFDVLRSEAGCLRYGVRINWGGIAFGALMTLALASLAVLFGNAVGLAPGKVVNLTTGTPVKVLIWLYAFMSAVICFGIGGFCGARLGDVEARGPAILHGLGSWAVSGLFIVIFGTITNGVFRKTLQGTGDDSMNWLFLCTAWFGGLAAAFGGMNSTSSVTVVSEKEMQNRESSDLGNAA